MQIIYKFRVSFEEHDDVVRFIDIESTASFADFHKIIQESVGFDATKAYTFHMSNDFWRMDDQICDSEASPETKTKPPKVTILNKYINDPHQRFVYLFDHELVWTFYIELVKIMKAEPHKKYPLLARKEGEAPKQYILKGKLPGAKANLTEYDKMADMLIASRMMDEIVADDDALDTEDIDLGEIDKDIIDIKIPDVIAPIKERVPFNLKFDEEELKIDADDFELLDGEEGEEGSDEEKEDDEESEFEDLGGYNGDENNDDY